MARAFSPLNNELYEHTFWKIATNLAPTIESDFVDHAGIVAVEDPVGRAILDAFAITQMDKDIGCIRRRSSISIAYRDVWAQNKPWWILLGCLVNNVSAPIPWFREVRKAAPAISTIRKAFLEVLDHKARETPSGRPVSCNNITSIMLADEHFAEEETLSHTLTYAAASYETTTLAIQWAIVALSRFPSVQERLRNEVRGQLPSLNSAHEFTRHMDAVKKMPYLNAFCNEVLRHYNPISLTIREALQDTSIAGTPVPRGTLVLVSYDAINHDPNVWGSDATEFNPDRWINIPAEAGHHTDRGGLHRYGKTLASFSYGARQCPGRAYAMSEFRCFVAVLVGRFAIELEDPSRPVELAGSFNLTPAGGVRARFRSLGDW